MRPAPIVVLAAIAALLAAPTAAAHVAHTVTAGETLWSIAAQNNLTTRTVAVYNGLSEDANVVLGTTIKVPTIAEGAAALGGASASPAPPATFAAPANATGSAPQPLGGYVVRAGDTLSALAAQSGVPVAQMAYVNGLSPTALLLVGTVLKLPTGAPAPARAAQPAPQARILPGAGPQPTAGHLGAERVKALAAQHGAPASLAAAIAWQESGFNNAAVSTANARGIMQVLPGTWDWVQRNLTTSPLNPQSPEDNVRAGSLYLGRLLRETNGDIALAAAGYYQGLASVRSRGMFEDTKRYVANVMALRARFGG